MSEVLQSIYGNPQVKYLLALVAANVVLGIFASLRSRDFRLTRVADWLIERVVPLLLGYGAAAPVWSSSRRAPGATWR